MAKQEPEITHPWLKAALAFGQKNQGWHIVSHGSEEYNSWAEYFAKLGWTPWAFQRVARDQSAKWTAPCQWPEWFNVEHAELLPGPKPRPLLAVIHGDA